MRAITAEIHGLYGQALGSVADDKYGVAGAGGVIKKTMCIKLVFSELEPRFVQIRFLEN